MRVVHLEALLTLGTSTVEKPFFCLVKVQVRHSSASVPIFRTPFFDSSATTSSTATSAQDQDGPAPATSEPNMDNWT